MARGLLQSDRARASAPSPAACSKTRQPAVSLLDHDQRHTLTSVLSPNLLYAVWLTPAWKARLGLLNGDGPAHLPPHSTFGRLRRQALR